MITMAVLLPEIERFARLGALEKAVGRRAFDQASLMKQQDLVAQAPRLAEVVRHHHDLGAGGVHRADDLFDFVRRARVEVRGRFVEKQHLRMQRPRARQCEPLLLAAGQHARGLSRRALRVPPCAALRRPARRACCDARAGHAAARRSRWRGQSAAASPVAGRPSPGGAVRRRSPARSSGSCRRWAAATHGTGAAVRSCPRHSGRRSSCAFRRRAPSTRRR